MRTLGSGLSPLLPNEAFGRSEEPFLGTQALSRRQLILKATANHLNQWNPCPSRNPYPQPFLQLVCLLLLRLQLQPHQPSLASPR